MINNNKRTPHPNTSKHHDSKVSSIYVKHFVPKNVEHWGLNVHGYFLVWPLKEILDVHQIHFNVQNFDSMKETGKITCRE